MKQLAVANMTSTYPDLPFVKVIWGECEGDGSLPSGSSSSGGWGILNQPPLCQRANKPLGTPHAGIVGYNAAKAHFVKHPRARQVLDYVHVPSRPQYLPSIAQLQSQHLCSSDPLEENSSLRVAGAGPSRSRFQIKAKKRSHSTSPTSSNASFPFVLSEEKWNAAKGPYTISARDNPGAYLKWAFYIDLALVPGRTPPPSFQTGKQVTTTFACPSPS